MILRALRPSDRDSVRDLLEECEVFTKEEARVALEVLDEALSVGSSGGYILVGAEIAGKIRGYICAGSTPLTSSTWHLYWICVDSSLQGRGVGQALLSQAEETVRAAGGERLVVETSGQPAYQRARSFYQRAGYREVGRIPDFYKKEDDCVLYYRELATRAIEREKENIFGSEAEHDSSGKGVEINFLEDMRRRGEYRHGFWFK